MNGTLHTVTAATAAQIDAALFATYPTWRDNGHDLYGALVHVSQRHTNPDVRAAAGEIADVALTTRWVWEIVEQQLVNRANEERDAQA